MDEASLQELIEEATVDCYGEDEEFWGFLASLENLSFPFQATGLGDLVQVIGIAEQSSVRRGVLVELEKQEQIYTFPLSELDVSALEGDTANWVAAYQLWGR